MTQYITNYIPHLCCICQDNLIFQKEIAWPNAHMYILEKVLEVAGKVLDVCSMEGFKSSREGFRSSRKGFTNQFEYFVPGKVLRIRKNFTNLLILFQDGKETSIMN